jgi:hypothetical protein
MVLAESIYHIRNWADFLAAPLWIQLIVVLVVLAFVGVPMLGIYTAYIRPRLGKITFDGDTVSGTAQVLSAASTNTVINNTNYMVKIKLRVQVPGREPYEAQTKELFDVTAVGDMQPGMTVPVIVSAAHPNRVKIDWGRRARGDAGPT